MAARRAKARGHEYTLADFHGLALFVGAKGGKSWHFRYYWLGKQKRMSLGIYPAVSLREARALRDEARAIVVKGINPRAGYGGEGRVCPANTDCSLFLN